MSNVVYNLKKIRELRGLTQPELGNACFFEDRSAVVRISDYETHRRNPKNTQLETLAHALNVIPDVLLSSPQTTTNEQFAWKLLEMEDLLGLEIENGSIRFDLSYFQDFINEWEVKQKEYKCNKISKDEYYKWKISRRL